MKTFTDGVLNTLEHVRQQRDIYYELYRKLYWQVCEQNRIIFKVCKRHQFTADELMFAADIKQRACDVIAEADGRKPLIKFLKERYP